LSEQKGSLLCRSVNVGEGQNKWGGYKVSLKKSLPCKELSIFYDGNLICERLEEGEMALEAGVRILGTNGNGKRVVISMIQLEMTVSGRK